MEKNIIRCNKCLMPRDTKGLSFDKTGRCELCSQYYEKSRFEKTQKNAALLNETLEVIRKRGENASFDCVLGVSGGMDSTYLLYLLSRKHGLRCVAAYYRTPFTPQIIDHNIKKIATVLSVPLVEIDLSREYHRKVADYFVRLWNNHRDQIVVNLACAPCKLLNRELFRIARRQGIPTVVHGINKYESATIAAGQFRSNSRNPFSFGTNFLRIFVIAARGSKVLFQNPQILRYFLLAFKASVLYLSPYTAFLRLRYPSVHVVNYFHDHEDEWREKDVVQTLKDLGWRRPYGFPSMKKADCAFAHLKNMMTELTCGSNYSDSIFSNMVRYGLLDRNEALERLRLEGRPSDEAIKKSYQILGLPQGYISYFSPQHLYGRGSQEKNNPS